MKVLNMLVSLTEEMILQRKTGASVSLSGNLTARLDGENLRFFHSHVENSFGLCEKLLETGKNQITANSFIYIGQIPESEYAKENFSSKQADNFKNTQYNINKHSVLSGEDEKEEY